MQPRKYLCPAALLAVLLLAGCQPSYPAISPATGTITPGVSTAAAHPLTATPSSLPSFTPTPLSTYTPLATAAPSHAPTATPSQTASFTPSPSPTSAILRSEVLMQSNCRYGPGAPYLYKYGLYEGYVMQVIGRNDLGTWVLVQAKGGDNPCWVKASLLEIGGDVMAIQPTYIPLPQSPYYGPLTGVAATRQGDEVTVSWHAVSLRAGDDTDEAPYLLEAWVCQAGQLIFTPVGSYENMVTVRDEGGCSEPSHGRVFLVEKHGYTRWVEVPWLPQELD